MKQDAVFLAHLKREPYTQQVVHQFVNSWSKSFFNQSKKDSILFVFLDPEPWHDYPDVIVRVCGISFDSQKSFLGLNILGISDPPGPDIMWWKKEWSLEAVRAANRPLSVGRLSFLKWRLVPRLQQVRILPILPCLYIIS